MGQNQDRSNPPRHHGANLARRAAGFLIAALACATVIGFAQQQRVGSQSQFDSEKSWNALTAQLAFGTRNPGSESHIKCRDWIESQLKESCDTVRLQPFTHVWSKTRAKVSMWNVIGEQNWDTAKTRVLLIAHWDTRPEASQEEDSARRAKPIMGANDGASGVAVLLELARVMKGRLPEGVGVMYLMTDGEDLGPDLNEMFLGARAFAAKLPDKAPTYGILLDMIGDKDLKVPMEPNSTAYAPALMRALYDHAAQVGLGKTFPKTQGPWIEDDHICLNEAGLKTIDLIDFDYEPWHTLNDTADKCSADSLGKVGKLLETWLLKNPPFTM